MQDLLFNIGCILLSGHTQGWNWLRFRKVFTLSKGGHELAVVTSRAFFLRLALTLRRLLVIYIVVLFIAQIHLVVAGIATVSR